jgi:hypothetical protein
MLRSAPSSLLLLTSRTTLVTTKKRRMTMRMPEKVMLFRKLVTCLLKLQKPVMLPLKLLLLKCAYPAFGVSC